MKEMVRKVFGNDIGFKVIEKDHNIIHSVFDIEIEELNGIFTEGRIVLIYSLKKYGKGWTAREPYPMKVGINMIVYALQSGGIAQQLIDGSTSPIRNLRKWWEYREN